MKPIKCLALLTFAMAMAGCASSTSASRNAADMQAVGNQHNADHDRLIRNIEHGRHLERSRKFRNADGSCRKRGCDNYKLFFDPGDPEPNVIDIHRDW